VKIICHKTQFRGRRHTSTPRSRRRCQFDLWTTYFRPGLQIGRPGQPSRIMAWTRINNIYLITTTSSCQVRPAGRQATHNSRHAIDTCTYRCTTTHTQSHIHTRVCCGKHPVTAAQPSDSTPQCVRKPRYTPPDMMKVLWSY